MSIVQGKKRDKHVFPKVVEVCNVNFGEDLTVEEIDDILNIPNPHVNAIRWKIAQTNRYKLS